MANVDITDSIKPFATRSAGFNVIYIALSREKY